MTKKTARTDEQQTTSINRDMSVATSLAHTRRALGRQGEEAAAVFLQNLGQRIIARNWRCRLGEVDLITRDGDTIVFCEVKTRKSLGAGQPFESITARKQQRYSRLAEFWLSRHQEEDCAVRFDAVSILVKTEHEAELTLIKGAFLSEEGS
ncbi:MAG: YraN family protein [Actinomycetia bacterium]|nr:YraN family protein [Actinomycetes bacterium]